MTKFETLGRKLAAIVCTALLSTTMIVGAVGPAQAGSANAPAALARLA